MHNELINNKHYSKLSLKTIVAIVIGNAIEVYDFVIYSFMTVFLAKLFFPNINDTNALLATMSTFGVAFFMRPLGGVILGVYADRNGRKAAITVVITIMTIAMLLIAFVPTYSSIGIFAPLLVVVARLLQGFATGGEFGASTSMLIELAPSHRRGFYGSWQMFGQAFAILVGACLGTLLTGCLSQDQIENWGWRLPFIAGLLIAPIGIYIRMYLDETHKSNDPLVSKYFGLAQTIRNYLPQIMVAMGLVIGGTVSTYINLFYMPTYAVKYLHLPMHASFIATVTGILVTVILIPIFGWWSDRVGRNVILFSAILTYLLLIYPLFFWLNQFPSIATLVYVQLIFCSILGAYFGPFAAFITELFPSSIRSTALGLSYNLGIMLFGGFAQFIVTWLIEVNRSPMAIIYYLFMAFIIALLSLLFGNRYFKPQVVVSLN